MGRQQSAYEHLEAPCFLNDGVTYSCFSTVLRRTDTYVLHQPQTSGLRATAAFPVRSLPEPGRDSSAQGSPTAQCCL